MKYRYSAVEINKAFIHISLFIILKDTRLLNQTRIIGYNGQKLSKIIYLVLEDAKEFKAIKLHLGNDRDWFNV